jgi:ADP-ribose pyrophosphatase YjhB (NUDIX family)
MIHAAGGIVWRETSEGRKVAVVHRSRYDDWCLPKGKLEEKESWEEGALREVKEETGCEARIIGVAGPVSYEAGGQPKLVLFFTMDAIGECLFEQSREVKEVVWLSPEEALKKLDYEGEKAVLMANAAHEEGMLERLGRWAAPGGDVSSHTTYSRLVSSIETFRVESQVRVKERKAEKESWAQAAQLLLSRTQAFLEKDDIDAAWRCFHAAARMEIFGYDETELASVAMVLRREAEKLKDWRKKAVYDLIGHAEPPKGQGSVTPDATRVYLATLIRDDHYDNQYFKISLRRSNLRVLTPILLFGIIAIPLLAWLSILPGFLSNWKELVAVELFGVMGASFSVAITLTQGSLEDRIPDQVIGSFLTWMRPAIGAVAAVAAYVMMHANILQAVISKELTGSTAGMLAVAFIAGFSERLVIRAIVGTTAAKDKKAAS